MKSCITAVATILIVFSFHIAYSDISPSYSLVSPEFLAQFIPLNEYDAVKMSRNIENATGRFPDSPDAIMFNDESDAEQYCALPPQVVKVWSEGDRVILVWSGENPDNYRYNIYRQEETGFLSLLNVVPIAATEYILPSELEVKGSLYFVESVAPDGSASSLSMPASRIVTGAE
ncbi:MAG TPA: hypothetical protein PLN69_00330 [bacterium]|nr:hypothetical protein [bacterium]